MKKNILCFLFAMSSFAVFATTYKWIGGSTVANTAERPKSCIIRVKNSDGSWEALASEFEGIEKEFAPTNCVGVMFASSRKAWLIIEK
mgnify:CR=1 FL=1